MDDVPSPDGCLYAVFVTSTKAAAKVKHVDPKQALASPGAVAFISAADIPEGGANVGSGLVSAPENLFATDVVEYVGHPLGIMVLVQFDLFLLVHHHSKGCETWALGILFY